MCAHLFSKKPCIIKINFLLRRTFQYLFILLLYIGPISTTTAPAQEINSRFIISIASSLQDDMQDPFDKLKLANDIKNFFHARVELQPSGHENRVYFQKQFKDAFEVFVRTLYTKNFDGAECRLNDYMIKDWMYAYRKNEDSFQSFYSQLQSKNLYYRKIPYLEMLRKIIQFVVVLNESKTEMLDFLSKITGIYPLC